VIVYTWKPSVTSNRTIIGLYRDGLLVCSIVLDGNRWRSVVDLDTPHMRPDDRAEVTRKLVELNGEIM